jgi:hypothetical protein
MAEEKVKFVVGGVELEGTPEIAAQIQELIGGMEQELAEKNAKRKMIEDEITAIYISNTAIQLKTDALLKQIPDSRLTREQRIRKADLLRAEAKK